MKSIVGLLLVIAVVSAEVYFHESFDDSYKSRWVQSKNKEADGTAGKFELSAGKYFNDEAADKGLKTSQDARFYQISAKFPEFSNEGKDLVIQYSVKHEQKIDCGGGYLKLLPPGFDQENFNGDTDYNIMFGPDICGSSTKKTHVIFNYGGKNHLVKKEPKCETDEFSHLYTLIVKPDNTYEVLIDQKSVQKGSIKEDFDVLPPKEIKDPKAKKPSDWVDEKTIADPEDKKPEGWDDIPAQIVDPDAKKPEDWDDELDGEWEAPQIDNPEYKGEWAPKMIPNPAYKGEWIHPMIPNPEYKDDDNIYKYKFGGVGIEIWQVKAGTIFDNILITDDIAEANKIGEATLKLKEVETKLAAKDEEERQKREEEERKKAEAEADEKEAEDEADDDDDHVKDEL